MLRVKAPRLKSRLTLKAKALAQRLRLKRLKLNAEAQSSRLIGSKFKLRLRVQAAQRSTLKASKLKANKG